MSEPIQDSLSAKVLCTTSGYGPYRMMDVGSLGASMMFSGSGPIPFHYVQHHTPVNDDSGGRMLVVVGALTIQAIIWFALGCFVGSAW